MKTDKAEDIFTLSPIQQGMLFHILSDADSAMYYEQEVCHLRGEIDLPAFKSAWETLVERHQMLRTFFAWKDLPHPVQIVKTQIELPFFYRNLCESDANEQQAEIRQFLQSDAKNSAKIYEAPLFCLNLFRTDESECVFVLSMHHLIHDAWSFAVLLDEFIEVYTAKTENCQPRLLSCGTYKDYVVWLKRQGFSTGIHFWQKTLENFTVITPLPVKRNSVETARQKNLKIETGDIFGKEERFLSAEISVKLGEKARRENVTPNIIFQSLWAILTAHQTEREKVVFGVTVAGRPVSLPNVETIVGNFINTLPLAVLIKREENLVAFWQRLQKHQAQASLYEHIPLTQIASAGGRNAGEEMFESILVYQNFARELRNKNAGKLHFDSFRTFGHPNYSLTLRVTPGERFFIELIYDERVCAPESIVEIAEIIVGLCSFITENDDLKVADILKQTTTILKEKRKAATAGRRSVFSQKLNSVKAISAITKKN